MLLARYGEYTDRDFTLRILQLPDGQGSQVVVFYQDRYAAEFNFGPSGAEIPAAAPVEKLASEPLEQPEADKEEKRGRRR